MADDHNKTIQPKEAPLIGVTDTGLVRMTSYGYVILNVDGLGAKDVLSPREGAADSAEHRKELNETIKKICDPDPNVFIEYAEEVKGKNPTPAQFAAFCKGGPKL